jgi:hypothetical protein
MCLIGNVHPVAFDDRVKEVCRRVVSNGQISTIYQTIDTSKLLASNYELEFTPAGLTTNGNVPVVQSP